MLTPPASASSAAPWDAYIQATLDHALRIWWAFYWPTTIIAFVLSLGFGYLLRQLYENTLIPATYVRLAAQISGYLITYTVAIFVMRYILHKNFRHFQLGLVSNLPDSSAQPLAVTFGRALRVWWTYVWRTIAYFLLAWIFVLYPAGMFVGMFRPSPLFSTMFFGLLGFLINAALSLFVIYSNILEEDFADFRVALLPRPDAKPAGAALGSDATPALS